MQSNVERGHVSVVMQGYKRYRVSSQRFSKKPMNVEFVLVLDTHGTSDVGVDELSQNIHKLETAVLSTHPEYVPVQPNDVQCNKGKWEMGKREG